MPATLDGVIEGDQRRHALRARRAQPCLDACALRSIAHGVPSHVEAGVADVRRHEPRVFEHGGRLIADTDDQRFGPSGCRG
jgi:hypothetical protein